MIMIPRIFYKRQTALVAITVLMMNMQVIGQKQTIHANQVWLGYFNQTRLSKNWGIWLDLHLRTKEDFLSNISQAIYRTGITYYVTNDLKLTAGYAYVQNYPGEGHQHVSQPEHRPWQQVQWHTKYPRLQLMQWFRLDERFRRKILNDEELAPGYNFNFKLRYNFFLQFPLGSQAFQPHSLSFVVNDEVHVNFGKQIVYNYFDQNRFFLGFAYHLNKHDNLQFGYMNVFQQLAAGNRYKSVQVLRIFYFQNLDLRNVSRKAGAK